MGDGINDAAAMRQADVGISVDTAVDIAKESADIILLEKNLMVLEQGVIEGRKVFGNIIKYIKMTASSNFGNVFSVLVASACINRNYNDSRYFYTIYILWNLCRTATITIFVLPMASRDFISLLCTNTIYKESIY